MKTPNLQKSDIVDICAKTDIWKLKVSSLKWYHLCGHYYCREATRAVFAKAFYHISLWRNQLCCAPSNLFKIIFAVIISPITSWDVLVTQYTCRVHFSLRNVALCSKWRHHTFRKAGISPSCADIRCAHRSLFSNKFLRLQVWWHYNETVPYHSEVSCEHIQLEYTSSFTSGVRSCSSKYFYFSTSRSACRWGCRIWHTWHVQLKLPSFLPSLALLALSVVDPHGTCIRYVLVIDGYFYKQCDICICRNTVITCYATWMM